MSHQSHTAVLRGNLPPLQAIPTAVVRFHARHIRVAGTTSTTTPFAEVCVVGVLLQSKATEIQVSTINCHHQSPVVIDIHVSVTMIKVGMHVQLASSTPGRWWWCFWCLRMCSYRFSRQAGRAGCRFGPPCRRPETWT